MKRFRHGQRVLTLLLVVSLSLVIACGGGSDEAEPTNTVRPTESLAEEGTATLEPTHSPTTVSASPPSVTPSVGASVTPSGTPSPEPSSTPAVAPGLPTAPQADATGIDYAVVGTWNIGVLGLGAMAIGPEGNLHMVDFGADRALAFTPQGAPIAIYDFSSDDRSGVQQNDVAVSQSGDVAILDQDMNRVLVYAPDGTLLSEWGGTFSFEPGTAFDARAIAIDADGNIFLADPTPRIQAFTRDGELLGFWERVGDDPVPHDVQDMQIVGDTLFVLGDLGENYAIVPYTLDGSLSGEALIFYPRGDERGLKPTSFAVAPDGSFFVVDPYLLDVRRVSPDGTITARWPIEGTLAGSTLEIEVDPQERVYLANGSNGTMTVYAPVVATAGGRDDTPNLTIAPAMGDCRARAAAVGDGFVPGSTVSIVALSGDVEREVTKATVESDGTFSAPLPLGEIASLCETSGTLTFEARGADNRIASATFTVTATTAVTLPSISVTPASGDCSMSPTVSGSGFNSEETVSLFLSSDSNNYRKLAEDIDILDDGTFNSPVDLFVMEVCGDREVTFRIHAVAEPPPTAIPSVALVASATYTLVP